MRAEPAEAPSARPASPLSASSPALVRLIVPALPGFLELTVLARAELATAGFAVQERATPAGDSSAWLDEARRDGALAVVILGGTRSAPGARVWLLGPAGADHPHELQSPAARRPSDGLILRARTTLAVRIAEHVREHRSFTLQHLGAAGRAGAAIAAPASPGEPAPRAQPSALAPAAAVALLGAVAVAAPAPPGRGGAVGVPASIAVGAEGRRRTIRLEAALLAGRSLHPQVPSVGLDLGIARLFGRGFARFGLSARMPTSPLVGPGGTVRLYEAATWVGMGLAGPPFAQRLRPEMGFDVGVQHTKVVGRGAPGFQGHDESSWSPALAGTVGLGLQLGRSSAALLGLRVFDLLAVPVVLIDETTVTRPGPGYEGRLAFRIDL